MNWFLDLTTRTKLFVSFGVMIVLLAVVMITAYRGITAIETSQKNLYAQEFANAVDLKDIRANQNGMRAALLTMMLVSQRSDQEALQQAIKQRVKEVDETLQRLRERARNDPELLRRLEEFITIRSAFRQTQDTEIIPLIYEGKLEEAKRLLIGIEAELNEKMQSIADVLVDEAEKQAQIAVIQSEHRAHAAVRLFLVLGLLALLLSVAMAVFLNRILASPLKVISGMAERVASGDLTVNMPVDDRADEVGCPGADVPPHGGKPAGGDARDFGGRQCARGLRQ